MGKTEQAERQVICSSRGFSVTAPGIRFNYNSPMHSDSLISAALMDVIETAKEDSRKFMEKQDPYISISKTITKKETYSIPNEPSDPFSKSEESPTFPSEDPFKNRPFPPSPFIDPFDSPIGDFMRGMNPERIDWEKKVPEQRVNVLSFEQTRELMAHINPNSRLTITGSQDGYLPDTEVGIDCHYDVMRDGLMAVGIDEVGLPHPLLRDRRLKLAQMVCDKAKDELDIMGAYDEFCRFGVARRYTRDDSVCQIMQDYLKK